MKKTILAALLAIALISAVNASTLYRIRFGYYPDKIRAALDFDGAFTYEVNDSDQKIIIRLKDTEASPQIQNYVELNDLIVRYFEIQREDNDLAITIPLIEPLKHNVFYLSDPPRLIIDFDRNFLNIISGGNIANGVEYLKLKKGMGDGRVLAHALKIDLSKTTVEPALAQAYGPNFFQSIFDFLTPWRGKQAPRPHFALQNVKEIAYANDALAAVNGTFFSYTAEPLGALIINEEMVSCPIHDRTALFFDENNKPYIDNVFFRGSVKLLNGINYRLTGINQGRSSNDIILYTPLWGSTTATNSKGIELVIQKGRIQAIKVSNSNIPDDGYVLSFNGPEVETMQDYLRIQDPIDLKLNVIPYNTSPKRIINLVSGGPRLLKNKMVYISKHEEKFKADVARKRVARTAVGITQDSQLLLVTVQPPSGNGSNKISIGVTLEELAELMQDLGAVDAMNLDGGSSTTMIIKGKTVCGSGRKVSNALIVRSKSSEVH